MGASYHDIELTVNGKSYRRRVESRLLLSDFLRHDLALTGTHVGCEHGVCGACTVLLDGEPIRSCLTLAAQVSGRSLTTVEDLAGPGGMLNGLQQSFRAHHGLQCGFCTPGILMTLTAYLDGARENGSVTEEEVREVLGGHLCRCTGYQNIVRSALAAAGVPVPEVGGHDD